MQLLSWLWFSVSWRGQLKYILLLWALRKLLIFCCTAAMAADLKAVYASPLWLSIKFMFILSLWEYTCLSESRCVLYFIAHIYVCNFFLGAHHSMKLFLYGFEAIEISAFSLDLFKKMCQFIPHPE